VSVAVSETALLERVAAEARVRGRAEQLAVAVGRAVLLAAFLGHGPGPRGAWWTGSS
jgi:hypothetical protein